MKNHKLLIIYGIIIFIALILIMFIIPDDFFLKKYQKNAEEIFGTDTKEETPVQQFTDLSEQKERLKKKNYSYSYQILAYVKKDQTTTYSCKGTKHNGKEEGLCTKPDTIAYNEKSIKEKLKYVNQNFIDPEYIFNLVKDLEVEPYEYSGLRIYTYNVKVGGVDTEVQLYSDKDNIVQIEVGNAKDVYVMKYSEILY